MESLVTGIKEVTGCRIVTDARGEISEIHVTAVTEKRPQLVARDVDTILKVKGGIDVDHRKIQVAILGGSAPPAEPDPTAPGAVGGPPPAEEPRGLEILMEDEGPEARLVYEKLTVSHEGGAVTAAVQLRRGDQTAVGEVEAADTPDGHLAAVVHATLEAVLLLHETAMRFNTPHFEILGFGREEVLVVHLEAVEERDLHSFTGSAVIRQDQRQAAVLATLAALNRLTGLWAGREHQELDIL